MFEYAYDFASIDEGYFDVTANRKQLVEIAEIFGQAAPPRLWSVSLMTKRAFNLVTALEPNPLARPNVRLR